MASYVITSWVFDAIANKQIVMIRLADGSAMGPFEYPPEYTTVQVIDDLNLQAQFVTIAPPEIEVTIT